MLPIAGVYEVAVPVKDLPVAEAFYTGVLGLEVGLRDEERDRVFLGTDGPGPPAMVVLQRTVDSFAPYHFAFRVDRARDLETAKRALEEAGVVVRGPVHHEWMGADSIYFEDPDGHSLECVFVPKANPDRRFAVATYNAIWDLIGKPSRTPPENERMIDLAHTSRHHWQQVGNETNGAVGEWILSRVYLAVGRTEAALGYASRNLRICEEAKLPPFYLAYGHEGMARALGALDRGAEARKHLGEARRILEGITDEEERELLVGDLDALEEAWNSKG
jgi:catechol 2,3-dioxygenase-like lactoylglutathione lyase family enzyme